MLHTWNQDLWKIKQQKDLKKWLRNSLARYVTSLLKTSRNVRHVKICFAQNAEHEADLKDVLCATRSFMKVKKLGYWKKSLIKYNSTVENAIKISNTKTEWLTLTIPRKWSFAHFNAKTSFQFNQVNLNLMWKTNALVMSWNAGIVIMRSTRFTPTLKYWNKEVVITA